MKLLVTGGAGFIGSHLAEKLAESNQLTVVDDLSNGTLANLKLMRRKIKFVNHDLSKESVVRRIGRVEGIFHLACHPRSFSFNKPTRDVDVNLRATMNVLELAMKSDAKVMFTSNSGIYGDPEYLPMDEKHPINCKTPYDVNKYASELQMLAYHQQYNLATVACRLATVYGPRQRVNETLGWRPVVASFVEKLVKGKRPTVFGDGEQTRDLIYVKDVVRGLEKAFYSEKATGDAFNLGTGVETSINSLLSTVAGALGRRVEPEQGPPSVGELKRMCLSIAKARETFGFDLKYPLTAALEEYVDWYKTRNQEPRVTIPA